MSRKVEHLPENEMKIDVPYIWMIYGPSFMVLLSLYDIDTVLYGRVPL